MYDKEIDSLKEKPLEERVDFLTKWLGMMSLEMDTNFKINLVISIVVPLLLSIVLVILALIVLK